MLRDKKIKLKRKIGKKGFSIVGFAAAGIIIAIIAVVMINMDVQKDKQPFVGNAQLPLLQYDRILQNKLTMLIDPAAEYSVQRAYAQLAQQGGLLEEDCGSFDEYYLWKTGQKRCYPYDNEDHFISMLKLVFEEYMASFEDIPADNYDIHLIQQAQLDLEDNEVQEQQIVIGTAKKPIQIKTDYFALASKPHFKVMMPYSLDDYAFIMEAIKGKHQPTTTSERGLFPFVELCQSYATPLFSCVESWAEQKTQEPKVQQKGLVFQAGDCEKEEGVIHYEGDKIKFCVQTRKLGLFFDQQTKTYRLQPIYYKFAMDFSDRNIETSVA